MKKKDTAAVVQGVADWLGRNFFGLETPGKPPPGLKRIRLGTWMYEADGQTVVVFKRDDPSFGADKEGDWYWSITAQVNGILKEIASGYANTLTDACAAALTSFGRQPSAGR
jgi:hypothetical protein